MSHGDTWILQDTLEQRLTETMTASTSPLLPRSEEQDKPPIRRILFGIPDPSYIAAVYRRISERKWTEFCGRWNIDQRTGNPVMTEVGDESEYNWSLVSTDDPDVIPQNTGKTCTLMEVEDDIVAGTVTVQVEAVVVGSKNKSAEVNQQQPEVVELKSPGPERKRFCSGTGAGLGTKQRSITDYMKEKKKQPQNSDNKPSSSSSIIKSSGSLHQMDTVRDGN